MSPDRRSLTLTADQWSRLETLAETTGSKSTKGPTAGQPSWRALIRRIVDREIEISPTLAGSREIGD